MKPSIGQPRVATYASLPSLGEWIETVSIRKARALDPGLSLHWESGLKHTESRQRVGVVWSLPSLGEWIETPAKLGEGGYGSVSPFIGRVD